MSPLPQSALDVLGQVSRDLTSRKPLMAQPVGKLSAPEIRRSLSQAARAAKPGQLPCALYSPKHGEPLLVMRAQDLGDLADRLKQTEDNDEGWREP